MNYLSGLLLLFISTSSFLGVQGQAAIQANYLAISQTFLETVKQGKNADSLVVLLAVANEDSLSMHLNEDGKRKAFWLNLYNGFTVYLLTVNPALYKKRNAFFSTPRFNIAGTWLSLDDVEHGILRRNKIKWSKGYARKWFPKRFNKKFEVDNLDPRIHFALNCGAKSCPPIAYYEFERIEQLLQLARRVYMKSKTEIKEEGKRVYVPKILSWFSGDFGGKKGILYMLEDLRLIVKGSRPKIKYQIYDWTLNIVNTELK